MVAAAAAVAAVVLLLLCLALAAGSDVATNALTALYCGVDSTVAVKVPELASYGEHLSLRASRFCFRCCMTKRNWSSFDLVFKLVSSTTHFWHMCSCCASSLPPLATLYRHMQPFELSITVAFCALPLPAIAISMQQPCAEDLILPAIAAEIPPLATR